MPLSTVFRVNVQTRVDDKLCSFGLHYDVISGSNPLTDASDLCDRVLIDIVGPLLDCLASDVTFEGLYATCVLAASAMPNRLPGDSRPGNRTGTSCPANLAAVVSLQTSDPDAVRQGRVYVSGISKNDLSDGLWDPAFTAGQLTTFANALKAELAGAGKTFAPIFLQKVVNGMPITPNPMAVTAVRVTRIPFTQRRRTTRQLGYRS